MALLTWDKRLAVGTPSIDAQHRLLVEALNELNSSVMRGDDRNSTGVLLRTFLAYTRNHHASEETLMARVHYPELQQHRTLHRELLENVETHVARLERGESAVSIEFLHFLRDWLSNHIQQADRAFLPWIVRHATSSMRPSIVLGQTSNESWVDAKSGAGFGSEAKS